MCRVAVAGCGNNISALLQGLAMYRQGTPEMRPFTIMRPVLDGIHVDEIIPVLAFDIDADKVGLTLDRALFAGPNNFPSLDARPLGGDVDVEPGLTLSATRPGDRERISARLRDSAAEVLLLSLPSESDHVSVAYAKAAADAGVAVVNCSPDRVARRPKLRRRFETLRIPLIGDDLASHIGTSVVHRALLELLGQRGVTVEGTHQVNLGGNSDFKNLRDHSDAKLQSKLNALGDSVPEGASLTVIPSGGVVEHLGDRKVAYVSIEGHGWARSPFRMDLRLEVQDSSNAAGVIVDLVRIACGGRRREVGGFLPSARDLLKSPPTVNDGRQPV